jgi:hypothetical protein
LLASASKRTVEHCNCSMGCTVRSSSILYQTSNAVFRSAATVLEPPGSKHIWKCTPHHPPRTTLKLFLSLFSSVSFPHSHHDVDSTRNGPA